MEALEFKKMLEEGGKGVKECVTYICVECFNINSTKTVIDLEGVTEGGIEKGDWKVTIERVNNG